MSSNSKNNWNKTRPSSAAVPKRTVRAIRVLKKAKKASGGINKKADDQKRSDDRWTELVAKKPVTVTQEVDDDDGNDSDHGRLMTTRKISAKRKEPPPSSCDTSNKQIEKRNKKAAVTTATTKTRTASKAKAKANINNDGDEDCSLLTVEITSYSIGVDFRWKPDRGVFIVSIDDDCGYKQYFKANDIIVMVDGTLINNSTEATDALFKAREKLPYYLQLKRPPPPRAAFAP